MFYKEDSIREAVFSSSRTADILMEKFCPQLYNLYVSDDLPST